MTFDRDWVLLIAWLPIAWAIFEWRRTQRHLALALKALSFVAVLLALAEPRHLRQHLPRRPRPSLPARRLHQR